MNPQIDILSAELERLFSLDEMTTMSRRLLGLDPEDVGGVTARASFARALAARCASDDRLDALVDVLVASKQGVDPRVRDASALLGGDELAPGASFGPFTVTRKLGDSHLSTVYAARRGSEDRVLKVLRAEACRDRRAVQRLLTANRMVAAVGHPGLPEGLEAGEHAGRYWVSYFRVDARPLSARFAQTGAAHVSELRPVLRGILEALAALHQARLAHGDLKLENVLVTGRQDVTLIDFGTDRLRQRAPVANGHTGLLVVFGSPKTIAPEQVRGHRADAATDMYAFGAMLYELLSGKPVFATATATDAAFAHLAQTPEPPSAKAPAGWITPDVDDFVLRLLAKEPARRPKDALAVLTALDQLGHATSRRAVAAEFPEEKLAGLVDALIAAPDDPGAAMALEQAIDDGADPETVAHAFEVAASGVDAEDPAAKKALLYRAARLFDGAAAAKERAEQAYAKIVEIDPSDDVAQSALDEVRKSLGKYAEVVESLLARSESASAGQERARIFTEIGRLCAVELQDPDQGILAFARALGEAPANEELASEIERLADGRAPLWNEVLASLGEAIQTASLGSADRVRLLLLVGGWYQHKVARPDLALLAYQQVLAAEPANDQAYEGLGGIYRRGAQWRELVGVNLARAAALGGSPRARDLRAEAAEIVEQQLNEPARAGEIFAGILAEDPGHDRAGEGMARIAERTGDSKALVAVLEKRAEARRGRERTDLLLRIAEIYEDQLEDLAEARRRFETVLAVDPEELGALKGLDRIYNRTGRYRELLDNLQRQLAAAATPRQQINLYERMAALHEEEFLDHAEAARCLEEILALDPENDAALTALPRHYAAMSEWERLDAVYERHIGITRDDARRADLLMRRAAGLVEHIGAPERAARVYEQVLELEPTDARALEALARLREQAGDAQAAVDAIDVLAKTASAPQARAELWTRAAKLLEARGDRDGAIERYKLAIEAVPGDASAIESLRQAYSARGDAASVVMLLERELSQAEGKMARARLHGELARVLRDKLHETKVAEDNARIAVGLDPTNVDALLVLGDVAFDEERFVEASKHLEPLVGRASSLSREDGVRALVRFVESYGRGLAMISSPALTDRRESGVSLVESHPRLAAAVDALEQIAPDDVGALGRVARVMFDCNDVRGARRAYEELTRKHAGKLTQAERADAQWRLGESLRRLGELDMAVDLLRAAADTDPSNPAPLTALARVYEQTGDWEEFVRTKRRRLEAASGAERFDLLLEIGDAEFKRLNDRGRAGKTYMAALEERPDDRKLLTKLMQLYSEEKDWGSLVEVVLRLAEFVEDRKQRAKYMHTAAIVSARQLGEVDQALAFYDVAIDLDPALVKAMEEAADLRHGRGDYHHVERLLKLQLDQARQQQDRDRVVHVLDRMGELYAKHLGDAGLAIDAYEAAQAFDPEGKARAETLAELYASDVGQYLDKAVRAQAQILRNNPYRIESYKLLRRLYTEARRPDPSWCLCQVLSVLNLADADEERFYRRHRADNAASAQAVLDEDDWASRLSHHDADPLVTRIFSLIQTTIIRARTQPLEVLGYDPRYRIDLVAQPDPVCQTLFYAQGVFGFAAPPVFQNPNDPAGLGFLHAHTPSIVLGRAAFESIVPNQSLAFVAGRHLAYYRPGYYVRHLVPTGTGLKAWLFAAIKLCVPQFPIAPDLQGQVSEAHGLLSRDFQGVHREILASTVSKLLQSGGAIDLKKWVAAIDLTADRAGFLLAHDLGVATEVMRATEDAAAVASKERIKEIVLYSISSPYLELREKLGITVDS